MFWPPFQNGILFFKFYFSNVNLFMFSYFQPNLLKNPFGKKVFQIWAKTKLTRHKNRLFGPHFETVQHLFFFSELWFVIARTYMVKISLQNFPGKVVFYGWVPRNPPWAPTGVNVPWSLNPNLPGPFWGCSVSIWSQSHFWRLGKLCIYTRHILL